MLTLAALEGFHLLAARLHLQLHVLGSPIRVADFAIELLALYNTCVDFIEAVSSLLVSDEPLTLYCTNYVMYLTFMSACALITLLNCSFARCIDVEHGRRLINQAVRAVKTMNISNNDIPGRVAEVLIQMCPSGEQPNGGAAVDQEEIRLRVTSRLSANVLHDVLSRWRAKYHGQTTEGMRTKFHKGRRKESC
jgi:hypothetical protein